MYWLIQRHYCILKKRVIRHVLRLVLFIDNFAKVCNQLLFEHVCYFSALKEAVVEHGLRDRYAYLPAELHDLVDIDLTLVFEAESNKVVVVIQTNVNPMGLVVRVVEGTKNLYLSRRVLLGVRIFQNEERR